MPCSLIEVDRHFIDAYCLHFQGSDVIALMMEVVSISETLFNFCETT
jgi:hypothetical protein